MLVCQDPKCKTKKNIQRKTNARCPNCKKKMTLFGKGKEAVYRCVCGHTETQSQMDKRMRDKTNGKVSRKEMKKYINKKEEIDNNPFKDALKNLKLQINIELLCDFQLKSSFLVLFFKKFDIKLLKYFK